MSVVWTEVVQRVKEYLNSQNWNYSIEGKEFQLSFTLDNQLEECNMFISFITYRDIACNVHTRTLCPLKVPADREPGIIEFIARANYGMVNGYFSYQMPESHSEEGTIEYNSWLYCADATPSLSDVESSVDFPLRIMMNYGDALFNVLKRNANPEEEIQRVEG